MIKAKDNIHLDHVLRDTKDSFGDHTVTKENKHNYSMGMIFHFRAGHSIICRKGAAEFM